jgi:hypothetical protein
MSVEKNMELMQTPDHAWNNQDWETFNKRHAENTVVYWPGPPEPTRWRDNHLAESIEFFKLSPTTTSTTGPTRCSSVRGIGPAPSRGSRAR